MPAERIAEPSSKRHFIRTALIQTTQLHVQHHDVIGAARLGHQLPYALVVVQVQLAQPRKIGAAQLLQLLQLLQLEQWRTPAV